ncbi:hypothetical protein KOR34_04590 [Posidoniimonas corsicana]|uniref:Uncharacterized protein n=1 Tax=Posidoniimonas corsicana TaxID=1938618 RepID=A0A5C5VAB6_9BACT|nr:DUF4175 domain-containing protein [Posidoniimonas corsicana]TWT35566.1 hypothetical protein KOR34_04590 [Posidoniimonas corsicana]
MPHHHNLIRYALDTVRSRVRFALAGETAARTTVAVGGFVWAWLAVDRLLEPPWWVRAAVFALAGALVLRWLWRHSLSALLTRLPDSVIAAWIERRHPELGESLLTALHADPHDPDPSHRVLVQAAERRAEQVLLEHEEPEVVDTRRLRPWFWGAAAILLTLVAGLALAPDASGVYLRRLALSSELWPRQVVLVAEQFTPDDNGRLVWRVPRDTPLELNVRADFTGGHVAPTEVQARLRQQDGARSRRQLAAIGEPTGGPDAHQAYRMKIDRLRQDLEVRLYGGDARLGPLLLVVTPRPTVTSVDVEVRPPSYTSDRPYTAPADAVDQVPEGAALTFQAQCNKPLRKVAATLTRGDVSTRLTADIAADGRRFTLMVPPVVDGGGVEITLLDQDGIDSQPAYRFPLRVQADTPPSIEFAVNGVGRVITPDAILPTDIAIDDDHGLGAATLTLTIGDWELPIQLPVGDVGDELTASPSVDLLALRSDPAARLPRPEPGERLQLQVSAEDLYRSSADPEARPHVSTSQTETFTVVTPEDLVARLEEREVNLRRTFEQTYDEARSAELNAARMDDAPDGVAADELARRRRLSMSRLVEQLSKLKHDVAGAGEGFRGILEELDNNRIQNDDLKERIDVRIVRPLDNISQRSLPELEGQARLAAKSLDDRPGEPALPEEASAKLRSTVAEMESALNEMKAVETYNEVLALLRGIIDDQRDLSEKTGDARKSSLKGLLLD